MSKDRKIDDSELAEVTGGSQGLADVEENPGNPGSGPGASVGPGSGGGGGGSPDLDEDNPGGGMSGMEQSE